MRDIQTCAQIRTWRSGQNRSRCRGSTDDVITQCRLQGNHNRLIRFVGGVCNWIDDHCPSCGTRVDHGKPIVWAAPGNNDSFSRIVVLETCRSSDIKKEIQIVGRRTSALECVDEIRGPVFPHSCGRDRYRHRSWLIRKRGKGPVRAVVDAGECIPRKILECSIWNRDVVVSAAGEVGWIDRDY